MAEAANKRRQRRPADHGSTAHDCLVDKQGFELVSEILQELRGKPACVISGLNKLGNRDLQQLAICETPLCEGLRTTSDSAAVRRRQSAV